MNHSHEIITTNDGSHSIYIKELDEHYHSTHGAIQESKHVFIMAGLNHHLTTNGTLPVRILEIGLGTGLNALLTYIESDKRNISIQYDALEAFPVHPSTIAKLNYTKQKDISSYNEVYQQFHNSEWFKRINISENFTFHKIKNTLQEEILDIGYHLIYFDAFAPRVQPELWTEAIFQKLYDALSNNGILVTYCAKGEVKRSLKKVGFSVETLPGPPGKREMVRAYKKTA